MPIREVMLVDCDNPTIAVLEQQAAAFRRLARMCRAHPTKWVRLSYLDDANATCACDTRERSDIDIAAAIEQVAHDERARSIAPPRRHALDRDTSPSPPPAMARDAIPTLTDLKERTR